MFLRNSWYLAAWGHELGDGLLARTLLNEPVVLYRGEDGRPAALEDRCCHRSMPLSMGRRTGNNLQCGYHGLVFDPAGQCIQIPGQTTVPPGSRIRSYPVVERWKAVWIWMGEPAKADPALVPDWWWMDHPAWRPVIGPVLPIAGHYELVNDNLLDLSHTSYIHGDTIGNLAQLEFPIRTERFETGVCMTRWTIDRPAPPLYQDIGKFRGNVDRWQIVTSTVPCFSDVHIGMVDTGLGQEEGVRRGGLEFHNVNAATPETERSCFQFYAHARHFAQASAEVDEIYARDFQRVFRQDVVAIGAQQKNMDVFRNAPQIDINVDAPGLALRRLIATALAAEARGETPLLRRA
ncbi:MAG: aromatic ring-hydroxylating dioxygenase subunit alpha [Alphaproteobacteria bacterium]|nr:aromatic ring-hydroxylating dioxygenase subunit alpha [Alphaproteobacteria bacterium]